MTDRTELEAARTALQHYDEDGFLDNNDLQRVMPLVRAHLARTEITDEKIEAAKSAMENLERRIVESDDEFAWRKARAALVAARQTRENR